MKLNKELREKLEEFVFGELCPKCKEGRLSRVEFKPKRHTCNNLDCKFVKETQWILQYGP